MYKFNEYQIEWFKALRSGEYKQAQGCLTRDGGYCCLGVACLVQGKTKEKMEGESDLSNFKDVQENLKLRDQAGLFSGGLYIEDGDQSSKAWGLTELNDEANWPFLQIADYIEANPENVFRDA